MRYEDQCTECGNTKEYDLPIDERDKLEGDNCQFCDGVMHRGVGCAGFVLKGRGWEKDGYSTHLGDTPAFKKEYGKRGKG